MTSYQRIDEGCILKKMIGRNSRETIVLFLGVWLFFGLFINKSDLKAFGLQQAGIEALVQYQTFQLGFSKVQELQPRGDTFVYKGKILAAKQPGQFVLGALPYFFLSRLGLTYESNYYLTARLVTWFSASLVSALAVMCFFLLLKSIWGFSRPIAYLSSLSYGLATTILPYSGIAHHDVIAVAYMIIAFYFIEKNIIVHGFQNKALAFSAGLLLGLTIFTSMLPALLVCALLIYIGCLRKWQSAAFSAIGFLTGILPLALYNVYYYGTLAVGQAYFSAGFEDDITFTFNNFGTILHHLDFYFGMGWLSIHKYMPVAVFGLFGLLCMGQKFRKEKILFIALISAHCLYVLNIRTFGHCQYGPRYLIPIIPFAMLGLPFFLEWIRTLKLRKWMLYLVLAVMLYSFGVNVLGALHGAMYCGYTTLESGIVHHFNDFWQNDKQALGRLAICVSICAIFLWIFLKKLYTPNNRSRESSVVLGEENKVFLSDSFVNSEAFSSSHNTRRFCIGITLLIVIMNVFRFMNLEDSPPGFYIDEAATAVCVQCLVEEGIDSVGKPYPLFSQLGFGTPRPPTLLYFGTVWTKLFGFSIASFRAISAFFTLMTIIGLYFLARILLEGRGALLVALAASISPWAFQFSRIYWEAPMAPCFMIWGVYFFLRQGRGLLNMIFAGISLACAMYSYPPVKAQVPLLILSLIFIKWKFEKLSARAIGLFLGALVMACLPLLIATLRGEYQERFSEIIIFSKDYLAAAGKSGNIFAIIAEFFNNFRLYFSPKFLFLSGDPNLRHSTQFSGQLSWLDTFALIIGLGLFVMSLCEDEHSKKQIVGKNRLGVLIFILVNIVIGIIPAALTDTGGFPHALRAIGVWPFVALLSGYLLWESDKRWNFILPVILVISLFFSYNYLHHYFFKYPKVSREDFNASLKESARLAQAIESGSIKANQLPFAGAQDIWERIIWRYYSQYQGIHARYYLMNYRGDTCSLSRKPFLEKRGLYSSYLTAEEYIDLGNRLEVQGDDEEAVKHYSAAIERLRQQSENDPAKLEEIQNLINAVQSGK